MTRLRVRATARPEPAAGVVACVGEDTGGERWAWFAPMAKDLAPGAQLEVLPDGRLPCPAELADEQVLGLLRDWPAWRLARRARLELGSGLLVAGDDWLARRVLGMGRLWGCLWRAVHGASGLRDAADHWIDPQARSVQSLLRILPARPDAAIVVCEDVERLVAALAACRDRATVVLALSGTARVDLDLYPDAHRRGLRIVGCRSLSGEGADQEWAQGAARILALQAKGVLVAP